MKKRKTVNIPDSILDDERISDSEFRLFIKFSLIFGTDKVKINDSVLNRLNVKKSTFYRLVKNLLERQYLQRNPSDGSYEIAVSKTRQISLNIEKIQSQNWDLEREEERTKEEDKENHNIDYIYNNTIRVNENEKEREKKREKDPAEGLISTIENRGVHGDSSFMLDGVPSSSENPSAMADGSAKEIQERADEVPGPEKPSEAEKPERFTAEYREIIGYLNEKTGKRFSATSRVNQGHMSARLKEGFTVEDFKHVIDVKCFQWKDDAKMAKFLRPETLFGTKFDRYLNEEFKVTRKGPNGWEYTVTDEPDELDLIFGGGKHG